MARSLVAAVLLSLMAACGPRPFESPAPQPVEPGAVTPPAGAPTAPATPSRQRQYRLGAASSALVTQAHRQAAGGDVPLALTTMERALRIEPDNPLLWLELAGIHENAGHYPQAESLGHKALQLASGDARVQANAWHLIAESLRARDRNADAAEAEAHARALAPR